MSRSDNPWSLRLKYVARKLSYLKVSQRNPRNGTEIMDLRRSTTPTLWQENGRGVPQSAGRYVWVWSICSTRKFDTNFLVHSDRSSDRSSDKNLFNARNHNSNKSNNEHTAIQPRNATTKANDWNFIVKYWYENYDRNNKKITRRN